eukprot:3307933-Amphidinium_carterae.1
MEDKPFPLHGRRDVVPADIYHVLIALAGQASMYFAMSAPSLLVEGNGSCGGGNRGKLGEYPGRGV